MRYFYKILFPFFLYSCALILSACSSDDGDRLQGERIPITLEILSLNADEALKDEKIYLPKPYKNINWPQRGGTADHAPQHLEFSGEFKEIWKRNIGDGNRGKLRISSQPIIINGVIYAMDANYQISAITQDTGAIIWQKSLERPKNDANSFGGGLTYARGKLFVTTGYGTVYSLDAEQGGNILWEYRTITPIRSAPTVANNILIIVTINNKAIALNAETAVPIWTHQGFENASGIIGNSAPGIYDQLVVIPYSSGELYALRLSNGRVLWQQNLSTHSKFNALSNISDISALPILTSDYVIGFSHGGRLMKIEAATGAPLWDIKAGGVQTPWLAGNYLYVMTNSAQLMAVNTDNGLIKWVKQLPFWVDEDDQQEILHWQGPLLAGDKIFIANQLKDGYFISPYDGEILQNFKIPDSIATPPIVADGMMYILYENADLIAYQ